MAKKTNPKLIGAFVIGAITLVIVAIVAFGGDQYFTSKFKLVAYFPGASLSGLNVGSPVTFRGVKVGEVKSIVIKYDVTRQKLRVPIRFDLDPAQLQIVSGEHNPAENIPKLIAQGLRGQLQTVSLVTGQTTIDFNFYPDTPVRLFGAEAGVVELPTIPSDIEQLKVNVTSLLAKINKTAAGEDERPDHQRHRGCGSVVERCRRRREERRRSGRERQCAGAAADHKSPWHVGPSKLSLQGSESATGAEAGRTIVGLEPNAGRRSEAGQQCRCQLAPDCRRGHLGPENDGCSSHARRRPD
jgi:hypothetical protein